ETVMDVVANAMAKGPHLMGEQFTAADVVIGSTLRWGMMFKLLPERPEFTAYTSRLAARPAAQRAEAKDKELAAAWCEGRNRRTARNARCFIRSKSTTPMEHAENPGYRCAPMILALRILLFRGSLGRHDRDLVQDNRVLGIRAIDRRSQSHPSVGTFR